MVKVYTLDGITPVVSPLSFVHPSAVLIGDVIVGPGCYIGPHASLRGDVGRITIEAGVDIQDGCVLHTYPEADTVVEVDGHVGHCAVLHGCRVKRNALIGMNAVVMDNAVIGESAMVAAMAFVKAGMEVPAGTLVAGIPAKVIRALTPEELTRKGEGTALYQALARRSLATMIQTEPLTEVAPDRRRWTLRDME